MVLFSNGFENDFTSWSSSSGTPTIVTTPVHSGSKAASFNATSTYVYKTISQAEVYVRMYVRWNSLPDYAYFIFTKIDNFAVPRIIAGAFIFQTDAVIHWGMQQNNGVDYTLSSIKTGALINTWYCVELRAKCSTTGTGATQMWVDGTELTDVAQTNITTVGTSVADTIVVGQMEPSYSVTNIIDDVVIDTSYIGPISSAKKIYSRTMSRGKRNFRLHSGTTLYRK